MPLAPKKALGYTLLGTALTITTADAAALADDYTAELHEFAGFSATATGSASFGDTATYKIPDTILEDREYEARLERYGGIDCGIQIIRTRLNRD